MIRGVANVETRKIFPGHYTLDSIIKILNNLAKRLNFNEYLKMEKNSPYCPLNIENQGGGSISFNMEMRFFLGIFRD